MGWRLLLDFLVTQMCLRSSFRVSWGWPQDAWCHRWTDWGETCPTNRKAAVHLPRRQPSTRDIGCLRRSKQQEDINQTHLIALIKWCLLYNIMSRVQGAPNTIGGQTAASCAMCCSAGSLSSSLLSQWQTQRCCSRAERQPLPKRLPSPILQLRRELPQHSRIITLLLSSWAETKQGWLI